MVGKDLPPSVRMGQRLTAFTDRQARLPLVGSAYPFMTDPQTGTPISSLLPHMAKVVREIALIRSLYTEPINHDPAITFVNCGSQQPGRPSLGSWLSYGLGTDNQNLPAFVVLLSGHH